jgi:hypothetical protein
MKTTQGKGHKAPVGPVREKQKKNLHTHPYKNVYIKSILQKNREKERKKMTFLARARRHNRIESW